MALAACGATVVLTGLLVVLHAYLTRPFWYDEIWRAHFVSEPLTSLWTELTVANTPSAFGWFALTRLSGEVFGWHSWALRLPGFVALPLLGAAVLVFTRRFTGMAAAVFAVAWLCLNATLLDLATQLKPYALETAAVVAIMLLWCADPGHARRMASPADGPESAGPVDGGGTGDGRGTSGPVDSPGTAGPLDGEMVGPPGLDRGRLVRRTVAGLVGLLAVPGIFLIVPLVAVDLWRGPARRSRLVEGLPALMLGVANTIGFIGHQSSQRKGDYWDRQFLAGRGLLGGLRFLADQIRQTVTGVVPGIDRFDPSLLHGTVPAGPFGTAPGALVALAVVATAIIGTVTLARRADGQLLLAALGGAELLMLVASAARYWPFGPTRTNLFVVPLMVIVVMVGAEQVLRRSAGVMAARWAIRGPQQAAERLPVGTPTFTPPGGAVDGSHLATSVLIGAGSSRTATLGRRGRLSAAASTALAIAIAVALTGSGGLLLTASTSDNGTLWDQRHRLRGLDLMVDAAIAARQLTRPGDVVAVGGRLARPGWLYAMEASDDQPRDPSALPGRDPRGTDGSAAGEGSRFGADGPVVGDGPLRRTARADTVFFGGAEPPLARQIAARPSPPRRVLAFVFDVEQAGLSGQLAALRRDGWCPSSPWSFPLTGTLTVYDRCPGSAPRSTGTARP